MLVKVTKRASRLTEIFVRAYLSVVEKHVVSSKDTVLKRQLILDTISDNESTISWLTKVFIVLRMEKIPFL